MLPALFIGLGKLEQECHIELTPDAQPHCLYAPRRVALPLQEAVNAKLQRMQDEDVISPVCARSFAPWKQATTDHARNLSYYCLLALHILWCYSSHTSRSW